MSDPRSVYRIRLALDSARQARFAADLRQLDEALQAGSSGDSPIDPYSMRWEHRKAFAAEHKQYRIGGAGLSVAVCDDAFQFRLAGFSSLLREPNLPLDSAADVASDDLYDRLLDEFRTTSEWIPLSTLLTGAYCGWRAITWWSPRKPDLGSILRHAYALGIPRDFVAKRSVILRCRTMDVLGLPAISVPTCLDAFDAPVFLASPDQSTSLSGQAIDLTNPMQLSPQEREYVVTSLDVNLVEFAPVVRDDEPDEEHRLEFLWGPLEAFYATRLEEGP